MDRDWMRLGEALRASREAQGLSIVRLAEKAGVARGSIHSLEQGTDRHRIPPSLEKVTAILGWPSDHAAAVLAGRASGPPEDAPASGDLAFKDPRLQAIWDSGLPLAEKEQMIRDLIEADLRRARGDEAPPSVHRPRGIA